MSSENCALDLTVELRLRRWARLHYVARAERIDTWHPVVLNEMELRDQELAELRDSTQQGPRVVPIRETRILRIDGPHPIGRQPRATPATEPSEFFFA